MTPPAPESAASAAGRRALTATLLYAGLSSLWILFSDRLVTGQLTDPEQIALANTLKGWLYVVVSSLVLYALLARWLGTAHQPSASAWVAPRRSVWLAFAVTGLSIVGVTWLVIQQHMRDERENAGAQLTAMAHAKADQLWAWHQERMDDTRQLHNDDVEEHWLEWRFTGASTHQQTLLKRLSEVTRNGQFSRAWIVEPLGGARLGIPAPPGPIQDPVLQAAINEVIRDGEARRVGPWVDPDGTTRLAFLAPLAARSVHPAVIVLHIDPPPELHPLLLDWPLPQQSAESYLFRREGSEVLFLTPLLYETEAAMRKRVPLDKSPTLAARLLRGEFLPNTVIEGLDYRGQPVMGVMLPVGETDWWLAVKQDRGELMATAFVEGLSTALAGLLAIFAAAVAVYLYEQRRQLVRSTHDIEMLRRTRAELSDSEARYRLLAESGSDVVWLMEVPTERFLYVSPSVTKLFGYSVEEAMQRRVDDILAPESRAHFRNDIARRIEAFGQGDESARSQVDEMVQLHRDGQRMHLEVESTLITDESGRVVQIKGVSRDISARKAAEARILQLSQAMEQSPAVVIITDRNARIEYVNSAFERTTGYRRDEVIGRNPRMLQSDKTPPETFQTLWHALGAGESWSGEIINRHKSGREYVQTVTIAPVRGLEGEVTHYLSVQLDITAQRAAEDKAHQLAWFDVLTGLPNRHHLMQELAGSMVADRRRERLSALLLINLDRFKTLNEALGHASGDRLLQRMAHRLSEQLRPGEMLARLGGDEFALLTHGSDADETTLTAEALRTAAALHAAVAAPFVVAGSKGAINVTVSIGVALVTHDAGDTPTDVLRRADTALHRAKEGGGRQTAFFDATMGEVVSQRFAIEQDLRRGIFAQELRLYLQPQVNASGHTVSAEALVRWQHPEHGLVSPAQFIPVAEGCDLIEALGQWVLEQVCARLGQLHRQGIRLPIAVNISPRHFHQADFVGNLLRLLDHSGAQANDLILEITEGVVVQDVEDVIRRMGELTRHGVRFSIDDFGTGYSSLSYLKNLPIHEVKIDRSFVQDAPTQPSDAALVEAILAVASHLRLRVVAEGVETAEQAAFFQRHPGVLMQGYLFGRPAPADDLLAQMGATGAAQA